MTEKELRASIVRAAREFGWRVYFTWSSMHSPAGFPDLCMVRPPRLIFAELKAEKGKLSDDQEAWLADLRALSHPGLAMGSSGEPLLNAIQVFIWRPADLEDAYRVLM
jgi:hypothetical protein